MFTRKERQREMSTAAVVSKDFVIAAVKENADEESCGGPNGI